MASLCAMQLLFDANCVASCIVVSRTNQLKACIDHTTMTQVNKQHNCASVSLTECTSAWENGESRCNATVVGRQLRRFLHCCVTNQSIESLYGPYNNDTSEQTTQMCKHELD